MKVLFYIAFIVSTSFTFAQHNIGYVNTQHVVDAIPEKILAEEELERYIQTRREELQDLNNEFEKQILLYQREPEDTSTVALQAKEQKLQEMQQYTDDLTKKIEQDIYALQDELMAPVMEKALNTIKQVAKNKSYRHVFELTSPLVFPEAADITQFVIEALRNE